MVGEDELVYDEAVLDERRGEVEQEEQVERRLLPPVRPEQKINMCALACMCVNPALSTHQTRGGFTQLVENFTFFSQIQ